MANQRFHNRRLGGSLHGKQYEFSSQQGSKSSLSIQALLYIEPYCLDIRIVGQGPPDYISKNCSGFLIFDTFDLI